MQIKYIKLNSHNYMHNTLFMHNLMQIKYNKLNFNNYMHNY